MVSAIRPTAESLAMIKASVNEMANINKKMTDSFLNIHAILERMENRWKEQQETKSKTHHPTSPDLQQKQEQQSSLLPVPVDCIAAAPPSSVSTADVVAATSSPDTASKVLGAVSLTSKAKTFNTKSEPRFPKAAGVVCSAKPSKSTVSPLHAVSPIFTRRLLLPPRHLRSLPSSMPTAAVTRSTRTGVANRPAAAVAKSKATQIDVGRQIWLPPDPPPPDRRRLRLRPGRLRPRSCRRSVRLHPSRRLRRASSTTPLQPPRGPQAPKAAPLRRRRARIRRSRSAGWPLRLPPPDGHRFKSVGAADSAGPPPPHRRRRRSASELEPESRRPEPPPPPPDLPESSCFRRPPPSMPTGGTSTPCVAAPSVALADDLWV